MAKHRNSPVPRSLTPVFEALLAAGGVGTGTIIPRKIEWDGHTFDFHFIDLPGGKVQELLRKGDDTDPEILVAALCCEDGSPAMDLDQAKKLKLPLRQLIVREAMDVFGFSKKARDEAKKG